MNATTVSNWTGWIRTPGQRWQVIVTAPDEKTCWRLLRQHVEQSQARMIDTFVGLSSVDPNKRGLMGRRRF